MAASLPVGIPWPAQLTLGAAGDRQLPAVARGQQGEDQEKPRDIAASIQVSHQNCRYSGSQRKIVGAGEECAHELHLRRQRVRRAAAAAGQYLQQGLVMPGQGALVIIT